MKYQVKMSKYDAARLWQYSNQFYRAEKLYRKAMNRAMEFKEEYHQAEQQEHLANLDRLSAARAMSDILYGALQDYFDEPNDNHDD